MDPFTLMMVGMQVAGAATQAFGGFSASKSAKKNAQLDMQQAALEGQIDAQRRQQMVLDSRRKMIENIRNTQLARSMSLNNAVNQGAQFGSGLQGGQAQITGRGEWNNLGISQNLEIGQNIFGLNSQINSIKMMKAKTQSEMSTAQGISSLGGSMIRIGSTIGSLGGTAPRSGGTGFNPMPYLSGDGSDYT